IGQPEVKGVAANAERQEPQPSLCVTGDRQPCELCPHEQDASSEQESHGKDGDRRRSARENADWDVCRSPKEDVEERRGDTQSGAPRKRPVLNANRGHARYRCGESAFDSNSSAASTAAEELNALMEVPAQ